MLEHYVLRCMPLVLCAGCAVGARSEQPALGRPSGVPGSVMAMRDDSVRVAALEHRVQTAVVRHDAAFLDSILAPTYQFTHAEETIQTRAELLSEMRQPRRSVGNRTIARIVDSLSVEVHPNVAITSGIIHVRQCLGVTYRGYVVRFARVYQRSEGGHWQLLSHRTVAPTVPESPSESDGPPANERCS